MPAAHRITTFGVIDRRPHRKRIASAMNPSPSDTATSSGTRNRRSLAFVVSTSVIATQTRRLGRPRQQRPAPAARRAIVVAMPSGTNRSMSSVMYSSSLSADAHSTRARSGPGVLEHHRLVDHRQLEMRRRVVHRNPAGLGDQHDEEPGKREDVARAERATPCSERAAHDRAEVERSRRERGGEEPQHQGGFGERRDRHLAAAAHAAERTARIERRGREREAAEREDADQPEDAAGALERRRRDQDRDQRRRRDRRGKVHARAEHVDPGGGLRSHRLFSQELGEIVVALQQRRTLPRLHPRLHLLDAAAQQRRNGQQAARPVVRHRRAIEGSSSTGYCPPSQINSATPSSRTYPRYAWRLPACSTFIRSASCMTPRTSGS